MKIKNQTPTRIGLIGGGTDVEPFASKYGGKILSLAIDIKHQATLIPRRDKQVFIRAMDEERNFPLLKRLIYGKDEKFDLIYSIINHFKPRLKKGFNFIDQFDGIAISGLGSSGSAAVSMIGAFLAWLEIKMSKKEIALLAWKMETEELGWISGKQDQLAAAFGGINLLTFGPGKGKVSVHPLNLSPKTISDLRKWSVLVFTGGSRHSAVLQRKLKKGMTEKEKIKALMALCQAVDKGIRAIKKEDFIGLGRILNQAWESKKKSNPLVSNKRIDYLYNLAIKKGALGGKIMGAGGEGHMFFLCPPAKHQLLINALKKERVKLIDFNFDFDGLKIRVDR